MTHWTCPLCGWAIKTNDTPNAIFVHGTISHPATLPTQLDTIGRLRLIPALAHEAALTIHASNPTSDTTNHNQRTKIAHPQLPINVPAVAALQPADDTQPWRPLTLLVECSRITWESLDANQRRDHPQPIGEPAWRTECAWLADAWPDALPTMAESDLAWIEDQLADITQTLANVAGVSQPTRYLCPSCGNPMHLGEGDWMICETGAHQHPGPARLEREWRRKGPMSTVSLAAAFRIPQKRIHGWHKAGKLTLVRREGNTDMWLPWDIVRLMFPDIVQAIDERDDPRGLVTLAEASSSLRIPVRTLRHWAAVGKLSQAGRRGNAAMYRLADINLLIA